MPVDIISTKNMTFSYNGVEAISDISFAVKKGDYLGIVGPNGSGKSTLVKNILGIFPAQKGFIYLFGQPLSEFRQWNKIGYLPQKLSSLNTHFPGTVYEITGLGLEHQNSENLTAALKMMGVGHLSSRLIGELSYGEQQRVMLARALAGRPELLIMDEPTTALDPETRDTFYSLTEELNRLHGTTIVLVTHDIGVIGKYARQLLYLDKKALFAGTFGDFCDSPAMTGLFGSMSQHIICHQHDTKEQ
jgi:zinc transport system ATP-binding protein